MDIELPDKKGLLLESYGAEEFCKDGCSRFPELAEELYENEEFLHAQISILAQFVMSSLEEGKISRAQSVCSFIEEALCKGRAVSEIRNAVAQSFISIEELERTTLGHKIIKELPPTLENILVTGFK
ncbi:hypothetical protein KKF34_01770 [Myxococcota bacterium]|nr:hypothetical protein [Myxococcota bacterium]MBU1381852.1 hypothetical protein [Myxococcota bacterium]MBU1495587.1 hypothetical protein [Myxococcota bacterium]